MRLKLKRCIGSSELIYYSALALIVLTWLPISICLPGVLRKTLQVMAIGCFVLGLAIYQNKKYILAYSCLIIWTLFFVYGVWKTKTSISTCAFNVSACWAFCFMGLIYKSDSVNHNRKEFLLKIILVILAITLVTTIIGIQRYPLVVRELGRANTSYTGVTGSDFAALKREYRTANIAGWSHLFGLVFCTPNLILGFRIGKNKKIMGLALACMVCIVLSQLTFAMLLMVMLVIGVIFKPKDEKKFLKNQLILILFLLIAIWNMDPIFLFVFNMIGRFNLKMLTSKIYDLYQLLQGNIIGNTLGRINRYSKSWETFQNNPVLGVFLKGNYNAESFSYHSDFFDMMGFYGLFGIAVYVFWCCVYHRSVNSKAALFKWEYNILFMGFVVLSVLNPVWYSPQVFMSAFLLPVLVTSCINSKEKIGSYGY